jgi:hypothetical protein
MNESERFLGFKEKVRNTIFFGAGLYSPDEAAVASHSCTEVTILNDLKQYINRLNQAFSLV